ncbi:unnamed protein product [Rotaria socialis]|uniref:Integrase catalytic domain-containing protein n=1 Tax=Rotaria socialis TaxID=392032 RepID=A0A820UU22_9BILA|nr:unnamed protein product [Rotaria socialis]
MDFHGPITPTIKHGNKYIISLTDVLSKFVIAKAVRDCTASTAARFLTEEVILKYGTPKCILTDNGTHFTAAMMTELFKKIGITHLYSTPYHPMTNGQIERFNATMDAKIAALSNDKHTDWDEQLPFPLVTLSQDPEHKEKLNQYVSTLTEQAKTKILKQQGHYKERYDRHRTNPNHKIGDLVLIKILTMRNKYVKKKVEQNNKYKALYENGECSKFELSSSLFTQFYINRETSIGVLNDLIDYAYCIQTYSIDTEDQLQQPPTPSEPALIQIQFVHEKDPSIIILIETHHLPPERSSKFDKIKQLCQTILSSNNIVSFWGDPKVELSKFTRFNLFDNDDIQRMVPKNIQADFKAWFNCTYPTSTHCKDEPNDIYSLQAAIYLAFNEWLDKRLTLANWGCGIDWSLKTYLSSNNMHDQQSRIIQDEEEIRTLMTTYASNDCLAVAKLYQTMESCKSSKVILENRNLTTLDHEQMETSQQPEPLSNDHNDTVVVHVLHERHTVDNIMEIDEPKVDILSPVHEQHNNILDELEDISDDESEDVPNNEPQRLIQHSVSPQEEIRPTTSTHNLPLSTTTHGISSRSKLTKTQRNNLKKRANRYKFEIIRQIYSKFTITNVKQILTDMNIYWVNVNIVGNTLFLGLKNDTIRQRVDQQLQQDMFTKEHYERLEKKRQRRHHHHRHH